MNTKPAVLLKLIMRVQDAASFLLWIALASGSKNISYYPELVTTVCMEITAIKMMLQPKCE